MAGTLTRRQALAAGAVGAVAALAGGAGLVQAGVLPGRYRVGRLLGACDVGGPPATTVAPGPLRFASFPSERRGRTVGYGIAWPPGSGPGDRLPVVVLLHAAAGDERTPFDRLRLHHHLAQAVGAGGARPFALAAADGRDSGWRPTAADDPVGMVTGELLPLLSGLGLRTGPGSLGVLGWSAGGAAALRLAEGDPGRLAAVAVASPAVTGAGPEVAAAGRLTGLAVRVDCGANDPFADGARALAAALPTARVTVAKGCHDGAFWQQVAPAQLRFLADALGGRPAGGDQGHRRPVTAVTRPARRVVEPWRHRGATDGGEMALIADAAAPAWPAPAPTTPRATTTAPTIPAARPRTTDRAALGGLTLVREPGEVREPGVQVLWVQLLGRLKVRLDDVAVPAWPSGRGRSLFKYLVTHRDPWPRREQLMDAFWPEAAPAAARNSLNVAVHGLRRAFRDLATGPVVVLEDGSYRLGPRLRLWLDVDEFAHHVAGGRRLEAAGIPAAAAAEYERALALYQGDFLADDPYEEWPALTREHLLLDYLDVLDRLGAIWFDQHQYGAGVALSRLLVERDPCREDGHRRLMRCLTRQGQPHLALRQFQACADALARDLGVDPDPATVALAEQIRRHRPV